MKELSKPIGRETIGGPEISWWTYAVMYIVLIGIPVSIILIVLLTK